MRHMPFRVNRCGNGCQCILQSECHVKQERTPDCHEMHTHVRIIMPIPRACSTSQYKINDSSLDGVIFHRPTFKTSYYSAYIFRLNRKTVGGISTYTSTPLTQLGNKRKHQAVNLHSSNKTHTSRYAVKRINLDLWYASPPPPSHDL